MRNGGEKIGLFRKTLSAPFKGYAVICTIAAIVCPATLVLAAGSYGIAKAIEGDRRRRLSDE